MFGFISVKAEKHLDRLPDWLRRRRYDTISTHKFDKIGQPMITLAELNCNSRNNHKRGLIVCRTDDLHKKAIAIVKEYQS